MSLLANDAESALIWIASICSFVFFHLFLQKWSRNKMKVKPSEFFYLEKLIIIILAMALL